MNKLIKKVLNKIENAGFEAYLVGGYVRDLLVGKESYDIDITTNATPKELLVLFKNGSTKNLGGIDFKIKEYHFEITTFREEKKYQNRKPVEFNYVNDLSVDLKRRDFTINALCMDSKGGLIDKLNGLTDLQNSKIKMIGDPNIKLVEDPLRILRAIRFATILNFSIDPNLFKCLKKYHKEVLKLSNTRIRDELDKIFLSSNVKQGLVLLDKIGISNILNINYDDIVYVKNIEAMYAQINIDYKLPFTKIERENIRKIKGIISSGEITKFTIYKHGLFLSHIAGEILNEKQEFITKLFKEMPIHERKDININTKDLQKSLNIEASSTSYILIRLENLILSDKLKNKRSEIIKYIKLHPEEFQKGR